MQTQYKHIFTSANEEKEITIRVIDDKCQSPTDVLWSATGTNYTGISRYVNKPNNTKITFKNSEIDTNACYSVWDVWCDQEPSFRISIVLTRYGCDPFADGSFPDDTSDDLTDMLKHYEDIINDKYNQLEEEYNTIKTEINEELENTRTQANDILNEAEEAVTSAQEDLANARDTISEATQTLASLTEDMATAGINVDDIAGAIIQNAGFSSVTEGYISQVVSQVDGRIGGIVDSAITVNPTISSITEGTRIMDTVDGYIADTMKYIDVSGNRVNSLSAMMNAVDGKINNVAQTVDGEIVSKVGTYLNSSSGQAAISGSIADVSLGEVTFGGYSMDLTLGTLAEKLAYVDSGTTRLLEEKYDLSAGTISQIVAQQTSMGTQFTDIKQSLTSITNVVSNESAHTMALMEASAYTVMVATNGYSPAGFTIGSSSDGTHIRLDADKVVIPGDMLVGALSANTITLGKGASKFYSDGSGYVAKENIKWNTDGSGYIGTSNGNSVISWDSDGNVSISSDADIELSADKIDEIAEQVNITADNINLEGLTTVNGGFAIDYDGNMYASQGTFNGFIKQEECILCADNIKRYATMDTDGWWLINIDKTGPNISIVNPSTLNGGSSGDVERQVIEKDLLSSGNINVKIKLPYTTFFKQEVTETIRSNGDSYFVGYGRQENNSFMPQVARDYVGQKIRIKTMPSTTPAPSNCTVLDASALTTSLYCTAILGTPYIASKLLYIGDGVDITLDCCEIDNTENDVNKYIGPISNVDDPLYDRATSVIGDETVEYVLDAYDDFTSITPSTPSEEAYCTNVMWHLNNIRRDSTHYGWYDYVKSWSGYKQYVVGNISTDGQYNIRGIRKMPSYSLVPEYFVSSKKSPHNRSCCNYSFYGENYFNLRKEWAILKMKYNMLLKESEDAQSNDGFQNLFEVLDDIVTTITSKEYFDDVFSTSSRKSEVNAFCLALSVPSLRKYLTTPSSLQSSGHYYTSWELNNLETQDYYSPYICKCEDNTREPSSTSSSITFNVALAKQDFNTLSNEPYEFKGVSSESISAPDEIQIYCKTSVDDVFVVDDNGSNYYTREPNKLYYNTLPKFVDEDGYSYTAEKIRNARYKYTKSGTIYVVSREIPKYFTGDLSWGSDPTRISFQNDTRDWTRYDVNMEHLFFMFYVPFYCRYITYLKEIGKL